MRPFTSTIPLAEARRLLDAAARGVTRTEEVALSSATGRVAAADVRSTIDVPTFARSAMDGYAVVASDTSGATSDRPTALRLLDRIYTGEVSSVVVQGGTCAEIATGAPIPAGADAVVMVEQTSSRDGDIRILAAASPGQHVTPRGSDIKDGDLVVRAGDVLTPARVGALAATGRTGVVVYEKPRVAILSTGNEVKDPGETLAPGQIYDVNRFTLAAMVDLHGGTPETHRAVNDSVPALTAALDACRGADLIVFSGGSSVGTRDLIVDVIAARGDMIFHGVAIKPGKPTALARVGDTPFLGMPGNPTSCLSNAYIFLVPLLRAIARLPPHSPRTERAALGRRIASGAGRHQFYTVQLRDGTAYPAFKGSGDITSLSHADGYIEIPASQSGVEEGATVEVILF